MLPLAAAGYHVIAPDLRGYGRSGGTDVKFDDDMAPFRTLNEVSDMVALVSAFGYRSVAAIIGHDFGSPVSAWCAVVRPDLFRSIVLMSAPFAGPPTLPFDTADHRRSRRARAPTRSTTSWRSCRRRASTINAITRRARRTTTCGTRRRAFTRSCAPTTT